MKTMQLIQQNRRLVWILLLMLLFLLAPANLRPAYAAGLTVNSLADTVADDGACTLREAITNANGDDQSGSVDCTAGSGADTITFSVDGTITLGSTLPEITGEITIDGTGRSVTVSGNDAVRVMLVNASGTLNLTALTIADGFSGNEQGGGILNFGILNISNSTFFGNSSGSEGGAISNRINPITVSNSTFVGNSAGSAGGAIYGFTGGTVSNSTLVGNSAAGTGGAGVATYANVTLQNTIIANNLQGSDCTGVNQGFLTADSSNIDSDGTCDNATTQTVAQLNLGSLADNGGETQTIALLPGSTAIDAVSSGPATDQRGVARPQQSAFDVGAYEAELVCPTFPVTVADEAELNLAITCYNALTTPGSYTLTLGADIALTAPTTTIDNAMSGVELLINGAGFTVDGQDITGVYLFGIAANTVVAMDQITLTGANANGFGGGIRNEGDFTLTNSTVLNNTAGDGGGIHNGDPGVAVVRNSTFSGNMGENGGGIFNEGNLTVIHTTLSGNGGPGGGEGGAIANFGALQVQNSIFANSVNEDNCFLYNSATSNGYNLSDDASCGSLTATGDLTGVDPLLGPLADNGGNTDTFALQSGSPAIDHIPNGTNGCGTDVTSDQRGLVRPQGNGCDIGAFEVEVQADSTPPVITPNVSGTLGNNDWYTSDVTVSWTVTDDESTINDTDGCQTTVIDSDTAGIYLTCKAASAGGSSIDAIIIKRDATAPAVNVTGVQDGASYDVNAVPAANCDTQDATSGVAVAAGLTLSGGNPDGTGSFTATCDGATDNAGNTAAPVSVSYTVTETTGAYDFTGFLPLIQNPPAVNTRLAGQLILFRFSLNGDQGLDILAEGYPVSQEIDCNSQAPIGEIEAAIAAGDSSLTYNLFTDRYLYLWKTDRDWKHTCRQFILRLDDGSDHIALFRFI